MIFVNCDLVPFVPFSYSKFGAWKNGHLFSSLNLKAVGRLDEEGYDNLRFSFQEIIVFKTDFERLVIMLMRLFG